MLIAVDRWPTNCLINFQMNSTTYSYSLTQNIDWLFFYSPVLFDMSASPHVVYKYQFHKKKTLNIQQYVTSFQFKPNINYFSFVFSSSRASFIIPSYYNIKPTSSALLRYDMIIRSYTKKKRKSFAHLTLVWTSIISIIHCQ